MRYVCASACSAAAFLLAVLVARPSAAQGPPLYSIINVNEGSQNVIPSSINDNDQITGSLPVPLTGFVWMPGVPSASFDSAANYGGHGINNFGVIAGYFVAGDSLAHATHWTPTGYFSSTFTRTEDDLTSSDFFALSDDGAAAGFAGTTALLYNITPSTTFSAIGTNSSAAAVNNVYNDAAGVIGGNAMWADLQNNLAPQALAGGTFGTSTFTTPSAGLGISDADDVVGYASVSGPAGEHGVTEAFAWDGYTQNAYGPLGFLRGTTFSRANAINSVNGEVVGQSGTHAFLWQGDITNPSTGTMTDLNALVQRGSGWLLTAANALNSNGDIVGTGYYQNKPAGWLAIPTVPSKLALDSSYWSQSSSGSITGTVTFSNPAPFDLGCTVSLYNESTGAYSTGTGTRVLSGSTVATFRIPMPTSPTVTIPEAYLVKLTFGGWRLYAPMVLTP